jgi:hypothetical protein
VVDIDSPALERIRAAGFSGSSQMTPLRRINLSAEAKAASNIPRQATMFAWAFPLHALGNSDFVPEARARPARPARPLGTHRDAPRRTRLPPTSARLARA